jgi:hypothetical protein
MQLENEKQDTILMIHSFHLSLFQQSELIKRSGLEINKYVYNGDLYTIILENTKTKVERLKK